MRGERAVWFPVQDYATWFFTLVRHIFNRCTQERNLIDLESQSLLFAAILLICNIYISPQSCFKKLLKLLLWKNLCSKKIRSCPIQVCWPGSGKRLYRPERCQRQRDDPEGACEPFIFKQASDAYSDTIEVRFYSQIENTKSSQIFRCPWVLQLLLPEDIVVFFPSPRHGQTTTLFFSGLERPKVCQGSEWMVRDQNVETSKSWMLFGAEWKLKEVNMWCLRGWGAMGHHKCKELLSCYVKHYRRDDGQLASALVKARFLSHCKQI